MDSSHPPTAFALRRRRTMSITQTYHLAHRARAKLSYEASQPDHDLRLLVGHANMLDSLMVELADVEREQEHWFNQSVRGAAAGPRRIQWADRVSVEDYDSASSDSEDSDLGDDDFDEADFEMASSTSMRVPLRLDNSVVTRTVDVSRDEDDLLRDDLEDDYALLELVRTPSRSGSPPDLMDPDSDTSDDDAMPPSPADDSLPYGADQKSRPDAEQEPLYDEEYYVSRRGPAGLVSAISVY
ncbi:hypothetical protein CDD80_5578 [Ophiocordyceps camponoti-rufipedis]|uniref:Uncharacterized protein n=1 Tax=Ophiocordyceps camponoti-rufipedis TaxID=2004952 RepID=A0A2C5ZHA7_9HYPO|nr:hypothetical protein CDD80_5578 [Ophiocordyceps camponoti-rufipedis]